MKKLLISVTALLLIAGCRKEKLPTERMAITDDQPVNIEKVRVERPMFVNFYGTPDITVPPVQCLPAEYGIILGGGFYIRGTATHVGQVIESESWSRLKYCNMGAGLSSVLTFQAGQITAANGDIMLFKSEDVTSLISGAMGGVVTIVGGTGRFTDATGTIEIKGRVNFTNGTIAWTGSGKIVY